MAGEGEESQIELHGGSHVVQDHRFESVVDDLAGNAAAVFESATVIQQKVSICWSGEKSIIRTRDQDSTVEKTDSGRRLVPTRKYMLENALEAAHLRSNPQCLLSGRSGAGAVACRIALGCVRRFQLRARVR